MRRQPGRDESDLLDLAGRDMRGRRRPPAGQRRARALPRIAGIERAPVRHTPVDQPERVEAVRVTRVRDEHESWARMGGAERVAEPRQHLGQPGTAARQPGRALEPAVV